MAKKRTAWILIFTIVTFLLLLSSCTARSVVISFDAQGGSKCEPIVVGEEDTQITLPTSQRDGYDFLGWYAERSCRTAISNPIAKEDFPTSSLTYYAGWKASVYSVYFYAKGELVHRIDCYGGTKITIADFPALTSYDGYYWDFSGEYTVKGDCEFFAEYKSEEQKEEEKEYTIRFVKNGTVHYAQTGKAGTKIETPENPVAEEGYYFAGWSETESGTAVESLPTVIGKKDQVLYALFFSFPDGTDYVTYDVVGSELTITGLTTVGQYQTLIAIPSEIDGKKVTAIGYEDESKKVDKLKVFRSDVLEKVMIPNSVKQIGAWAFADCSALSEIIIDKSQSSLSSVGTGAFAGCTSLSKVTLPSRLTILGKYAFAGITNKKTGSLLGEEVSLLAEKWKEDTKWYACDMSLTSVECAQGSVLSEVGAYAFYKDSNLKTMSLPKGVNGIDYLTYFESGIKSISIAHGGNLISDNGVVYSADKKVLYYYPVCGNEAFVIPQGIVTVDENAFRENKNLREVIISSSVQNIFSGAFRGCAKLQKVTFNDGSKLTTLSDYAFSECTLLGGIVLPKSLVNFGNSVFEGDEKLTEVEELESTKITGIGDRAFCNCYALEKIAVPVTVIAVGDYAFYGCTNLTTFSLAISDETPMMETVGAYAFCDCFELVNLSLPSGILSIGERAFCGESGKMKLSLLPEFDKLERIGDYAFANTAITLFKVPQTILADGLGTYVFKNCASLSCSFDKPNKYSAIPEGFFYGCTAIESMTFTNSITTIGDYAMYGCAKLGTVLFERDENGEQKVTTIGKYAFAECSNLQSRSDTAQILPSSLLVMGEGAYQNCTSITSVIIPNNLEILPKRAFAGCVKLVTISYARTDAKPSLLHTLGEESFAGCTLLGSRVEYVNEQPVIVENSFADLPLPEKLGLREEGKGFRGNPFVGCAVRSYYFPNGNENGLFVNDGIVYNDSLGTGELYDIYAFPTAKQGDATTTVSVKSTIGIIEDYAFFGGTLQGLDFLENDAIDGKIEIIPVQIGAYAFAESSLKTVVLAYRVCSVGAYAFEKCQLNELTIEERYYRNNEEVSSKRYGYFDNREDNRIVIGDYAFTQTTLVTIDIPQRVSLIGEGVFAECAKLLSADFHVGKSYVNDDGLMPIDASLTLTIEDKAFYDDIVLKEMDFPGRLETIGNYAFAYCGNLERVTFEAGTVALSIGDYAFYNNHYLYQLSLPSNIISLGEGAFSQNTRLKYFYFPEQLTKGSSLSIPTECFVGDTQLDNLTVPGYISEIGEKAYYRSSLNRLEFFVGDQPLVIGAYAFAEAKNLTEVILPDNCREVGKGAFAGSGVEVFDYKTGYYTVRKLIKGDTPNEGDYVVGAPMDEGNQYYQLSENVQGLYVPCTDGVFYDEEYFVIEEVLGFIQGEEVGGSNYVKKTTRGFEKILATDTFVGTLSIGEEAFASTNLVEVYLSQRVVGVGKRAFADIKTLEKAYLLYQSNELAEGAFCGDNKLETVWIYNVNDIGREAFYGSAVQHIYSYTSAEVKSHTKTGGTASLVVTKFIVRENAFESSSILSLDVRSNGNILIKENAFLNCYNLTSLAFDSENDMTIEGYAFYNCTALSVLTLTADEVSLGKAFVGKAGKLTSVDLTENGEEGYASEDGILYTADKTELVLYPAGKEGSFVTIPNTVVAIQDYAFSGNTYLTGVLLPQGGITLGENAFEETSTELIVYVSANYVARYKNEWNMTSVTSYTSSMNGFVLTLQNSGEYYVTAYLGEETVLTIPNTMTSDGKVYDITGIGRDAFRNNKFLREVTVSAGIKTISNSAFRGCVNLQTVNIGDNVTGIKTYAFYGCTSLEEVNINTEGSLVAIGNYAFASCTGLVSFVLPKRLENIGSYAFAFCTSLRNVDFTHADYLQEIKNNAFEGCLALERITLSSTVDTIGNYVFRNCENLIYVHLLSEKVPTLEERAFADVPAGIFFFVPENGRASYLTDGKWRSYIGKIISADYLNISSDYPNYVLEYVDNNNYRLVAYIGDESNVTLHSSLASNIKVTEIGKNAFGKFVETLVIEEGYQKIGSNAFSYASNLASVHVSATVTSIGDYAFADIDTLSTVIFDKHEKYEKASYTATEIKDRWLSLRSVLYIKRTNGSFALAGVEYSSAETYYQKVEGSELSIIGAHAFYNCESLESISLPSSVTEISEYAFSCDEGETSNLTTVTFEHEDSAGIIGQSIKIRQYAFARCDKLRHIILNCKLEYLGDGTFSGCSTLTDLRLNYTVKTASYVVTEIAQDAQKIFEGCDKLLIILPTSEIVTVVKEAWTEQGIFAYDLNRLTPKAYVKDDFVYDIYEEGKTVTVIGYLGEETTVVFPSKVRIKKDNSGSEIEYNVGRIGRQNNNDADFVNGNVIPDTVTEVIIPGSVTVLAEDSFRQSKGLKTVTVQNNNLKTIEANAFSGCESLETVNLPSSLTSIAKRAFYGCSRLEGYFDGTKGLNITDKTITERDNLTLAIEQEAFADCGNMTKFVIPQQTASLDVKVFDGCKKLVDIVYNDTLYDDNGELVGDTYLTSIGTRCFQSTAIVEIRIPATVTQVGSFAFADCQKLLSVYLYRSSSMTITDRTVFGLVSEGSFVKNVNTKVFVPEGMTESYASAKDETANATWGQKTIVDNKWIGDYAYTLVEGSKNLTLTAYRGSETELEIPEYIFIGNGTSDKYKYYPETISSYFGTPNLTKVTFAENTHVTTFKSYAFAGCTGLKEFHFPYSLKKAGNQALIELEMGERIFEGCTVLTDVHLPINLTAVPGFLFHNCTSLKEVTLPDTVKSIGNGAFYGCSNLARLRLLFTYPDKTEGSANILGSNAFYEAGKDVVGGLKIIVPDSSKATFANNWIRDDHSYFTVYSDTGLFGDYLIEEVKRQVASETGEAKEQTYGYSLLQYIGEAEIVPISDIYFGGTQLSGISIYVENNTLYTPDTAYCFLGQETAVRYKDFVLKTSGAGWEVLSYEGGETKLDFTEEILGRKVLSISDEFTSTAEIDQIKVNSGTSYNQGFIEKYTIMEEE